MRVKRPQQHYDLLEVWWDDASSIRGGWAGKTEKIDLEMALSVGFLIQETDDHIRLASDTDGDGSHNGRTQIPKGMIKKIRVLRKKDAPNKQ